MAKRGFTSDMLRQLYEEGVKQGWRPEDNRKSGHAYLYCPRCPYREAFSKSGRGFPPEIGRKVTAMRRHGLVWKGRGGEHTASLSEVTRRQTA